MSKLSDLGCVFLFCSLCGIANNVEDPDVDLDYNEICLAMRRCDNNKLEKIAAAMENRSLENEIPCVKSVGGYICPAPRYPDTLPDFLN